MNSHRLSSLLDNSDSLSLIPKHLSSYRHPFEEHVLRMIRTVIVMLGSSPDRSERGARSTAGHDNAMG